MPCGIPLALSNAPEFGEFGAWMWYFFLVYGFIYMSMKMIQMHRRRPPLETEFANAEKNEREHSALHREIKGVDSDADIKINTLRAEISRQVGKVHNRVDTILADTAEIKGQLKAGSRQHGT